MSLWEKWENEKRKAQGLEVKRDVEIRDSYKKPDLKRQLAIVGAVILGCLAIAVASVIFESSYMGRRWSDTFLIRLITQRYQQREEIYRQQNP